MTAYRATFRPQPRYTVPPVVAEHQGFQMKTKIRTAALPAGLPAKFLLAVAAIILALLALPAFG